MNASVLAFVLYPLVASLDSPADESEPKLSRPVLDGIVRTKDGPPLQGASVFVFTAAPRTGVGILCPSCYPDCGKSAKTDAQGRFRIESLDPNLLFRLLVVGRDHVPAFVETVDPFGARVEATVEKRNLEDIGPKNRLRGRVVNSNGEPISNAAVNFEFYYGDEANCGGACEGVDPLTVTDGEGRFLITTKKRFDWMSVAVEARAYAKRKFFRLPGSQDHELELTEGAIVTGRVLKGGEPLKGVNVGLVSVDRSENFTGDFKIATNEEGRFAFVNVPPYHVYYVYGLMDSIRPHGALPAKPIRVRADGSTLDVGELAPEPGNRIVGNVVLSDGGAIPFGTQILLSRGDAWDTTFVDVNPDGGFAVPGVPAGSISLSLRIPEYRFSERNKSLDRINGGNLAGTIDHDIVGLKILLEPGKFVRPDFEEWRKLGADARPENKPLRGAEEIEF